MRFDAAVPCFKDTCNVYVLRSGQDAVLIDFGSGQILDRLADYGVRRVTDVLITHHHRDQVQGLARAAAAGIRIWVPPVELDLIANVDEHWRTRPLQNDYTTRQDRFSLLEQVPVTGTVAEYRTRRYGHAEVFTLPTPGHTVGSVSYLVTVGGKRLAFVGDLVHGDGRLWSLASTQWTYTGGHSLAGVEGVAATGLSCLQLLDHSPEVLLPSHGDPVTDPPRAIARLESRLEELLDTRCQRPADLHETLRHPWTTVSPHLLWNTSSHSYSYALLSDHGTALLFDFGYDLSTGIADGTDRASRRPLLASIDALRRDFGIDRVEVALPTHYHDDHVAGMNLLREVHGTQVWSPSTVTPVLEEPGRWDLPCLWYDPIPVDRDLPVGAPATWREYEIGVHDLPGHTLYASAFAVEVDGRRVLATGDQQTTGWVRDGQPEILNYQYRNRFRIDDFQRSAELYLRLRPELMISGHWRPHQVTTEYLEMLLAKGNRLAELHRELLPEKLDLGAEGFGARIVPYFSVITGPKALEIEVTVRNPFPARETVRLELALPAGWEVEPAWHELALDGGAEQTATFWVSAPPDQLVERARIGADLTVGDTRFGQQAEALVSVRTP
jgi:glyoxylase-like metal-dependent hydrolase (beta-lactamase superfamily II)